MDNTSQILFNLIDSSADVNGLHLAFVNTGGGIVQGEISGPVNATEVNGAALPLSKTIVGTDGAGKIIDASGATLANNTTGAADHITGALDVTNTPLTTDQDILYRNGAALARLPISTVTSGSCLGNNSGVWGFFACSGGSGSGINITVNAGSTLTGPANFQNGTSANNINFSNPSGSNIQAIIQSASVTNAMLAHAATTVAGQTCTLGSTCTIASTDLSDYGSVSPTGLLGASNAATTVNGQTCTLGSACTIPFQHNGSGNSTQTGLNLVDSTVDANNVHMTVSNPGGGNNWKVEASGNPFSAGTLTGFTAPTPAGSAHYPQIIAKGTVAPNTAAIAPGVCETTVSATATGALTSQIYLSISLLIPSLSLDITQPLPGAW